ncbi:MAG: YetF domain-containing protein [Lysobacterales bacterium]
MSDLFELSMPWWEFCLRAVVVYAALLVLVRLTGKRTVGQFTPFDMILLVLLGTAVQNSLIGKDISLPGGLILVVTLIGLNWGVGFLTARSSKIDSLVEGDPVLLARDGKIFHAVLKREEINPRDFDKALRGHGLLDATQVRCAFLETDGKISIIEREKS